jgi:hypothetical protein
MSNTTTTLIELRRHYEQVVAQSEYQVAQASAQLEHIDALLINGLLQEMPVLDGVISAEPLALTAATALDSAAEEIDSPPTGSISKAKVPQQVQSTGDRVPRQLLPAYDGLKRLEAISKALQSSSASEVTIDNIIRELFGNLSAADHKAERKRLNTLLYKGEKLGLWQKGKAPSSYSVKKSKAAEKSQSAPKASESKAPTATRKAKTRTPGSRDSLPLLKEYEGMTKLEAISKVLTEQSGHVLHQDSIIQLLYGDLSPDTLNEETRRLRASLFQGVRKGLWQKAPKQPSSYLVKTSKARKSKGTPAGASSNLNGSAATAETPTRQSKRKESPSKTVSKPRAGNGGKSASRGREQVLSLPAEFDGLSKIDAVSKVLGEHPGTVVHIEDIIERFYGELTKEDLKAEKDRMKDVMTRGVKRELWSRATGIPSSYVVKA